jgi:hypothetical protein
LWFRGKHPDSTICDQHKFSPLRRTMIPLKQDAWAAAKPQFCVAPAQCQRWADLPGFSRTDDELVAKFEMHSLAGMGPTLLTPHALLICYWSVDPPPSQSSPGLKPPPSRKGKLVTKEVHCGPKDKGLIKKRREPVSIACRFCRKRKITCRQPPPDSEDPSCVYVLPRTPLSLVVISLLRSYPGSLPL